MAKRTVAVSRATRDALGVLAAQIKQARLDNHWTQRELAGRVGVDARTIASVEDGSPGVAIGTVFNAAFTVGVNLFGLEGDELALARRRGEDILSLLPQRATRPPRTEGDADDDF